MCKKFVPPAYCNVGDIVANEVMNEKGITLVAQDTLINEYIKEKLIDLRVPYIWLYKPEELPNRQENELKLMEIKETYKAANLNLKEILSDLAFGDELDYEQIVTISKSMISDINETSHIIKCLIEDKPSEEYTYTHSVNVALYSMLLAKWLGFPEYRIEEVVQAGLLHDVGKMKIPEEILSKKSTLTSDEYEVIKEHSIYGFDLIKGNCSISENIKKGVLLHHEKIDGSGYPFGLTDHSITLLAKILSVADVYDALTQNRVYKTKVSPFDAFEEFLTTGIMEFDPTVRSTFLKNLAAHYIGARVKLSNGDIGEIAYVPPHDIINPIICVGSNYIDLAQEPNIKVVNLL